MTQVWDIDLVDVVVQFPNSDQPTLNKLNLNIAPKTIHTILGGSGSGKSVTLKCILGLLKPNSGSVRVLGKSLFELSERELVEHRKCFGMLFQNSALFDSLDVFENIAFPMREHRGSWGEGQITSRVEELLLLVDLDPARVAIKMPAELSGGMRKRVALARALALEPRILLFDEPTTGLDPITSQIIDELIVRITRKIDASALVISHNVNAAMRISDFVSLLADGKLIETESPGAFRQSANPRVREFLKCAGL